MHTHNKCCAVAWLQTQGGHPNYPHPPPPLPKSRLLSGPHLAAAAEESARGNTALRSAPAAATAGVFPHGVCCLKTESVRGESSHHEGGVRRQTPKSLQSDHMVPVSSTKLPRAGGRGWGRGHSQGWRPFISVVSHYSSSVGGAAPVSRLSIRNLSREKAEVAKSPPTHLCPKHFQVSWCPEPLTPPLCCPAGMYPSLSLTRSCPFLFFSLEEAWWGGGITIPDRMASLQPCSSRQTFSQAGPPWGLTSLPSSKLPRDVWWAAGLLSRPSLLA